MSCISDSLRVNAGGVDLRVPVVIASGTWAYEDGMWQDDLARHVGAICSKAITKDPCLGNPGTRVWETPSGILNSIGLQNEGIDSFIDHRLEGLKKRGTPVVLNICMQSDEDLAYMMDRVAEVKDMVDGVEKYTCIFARKCLFGPPGYSLQTANESITFQTPTTSGEFLADDSANKDLLETAVVDTEEQAIAWVTAVLA